MRSAMRGSNFRRTRLQALAAVLLALGGAQAILYAGFIPVPPLSDVPLPLLMQALGIAGVITAVGVYLHQPWGRWLGVAVTVTSLALALGRATSSTSALGTPLGFAGYAIDVAFGGLVLWVLLRRWGPPP